ncbi:MAG: toll/interleukin-1 receptor domain-containing protein [Bryobacteraceae bacterium]
MAKVFISSPRGAEDVARELSAALRERGLSTWLSVDDLPLGDNICRPLNAELAEADAYIILSARPADFSTNMLFHPEYDIEEQAILQATSRYPNKKVIPVLLDAYPSPMWRNWKGINAYSKPFNGVDVADQIGSVLDKPDDNRAVLSIEDQKKRRERIDAIAENAEKIRIAELSENR